MKELEDYSWFPSALRNGQTEFIGFVVATFDVYDGFERYLQALSLPRRPMTDLCSGSGEPAISIYHKSNCFTSLSLSDKYPNVSSYQDERISYDGHATDVLDMEFKQDRYYTMFNAFHHFSDEEKTGIVEQIQHSGSGAFIVEILEPTLVCLLKVIFTTTIGSLLLTPFIRPFSLRRLFFTYVLPLNVLAITYDGILSVLKSRSVEQYQSLFSTNVDGIKVLRLKSKWSHLVVIQIDPRI